MSKKTGIALGSGGARGLSSIGVLLWLKENEVDIDYITGCSMGAIVGGFMASGHSPQHIKKLALEIDWVDVIKFLRLSFSAESIFDWSRISRFLRDKIGDKRIEELDKPFACVATDLNSGTEVVFRKGKLLTALSASSSIPGMFRPVEIMDRVLVDGELSNPVPVDVAFDLGADRVIGVNACRAIGSRIKEYERREEEQSFLERMDEWIGDVLGRAPKPISELYRKLPHPDHRESSGGRKLYDVITDSLAVVSSRILEQKSEFTGPHLMITPPVGSYRTFDLDHAEKIIELGYREAQNSSDEIMKFAEG